MWWRLAAGGDTFSTTHNASNYPVVFDIYEFAIETIFISSTSATGVARAGGAGPTLSGLNGMHWDAGVAGQSNIETVDNFPVSWDAGVEQADTAVLGIGGGTDGYTYGLTVIEDSVVPSIAFAATIGHVDAATVERLVFALDLSSTPYEGSGPLWRARVYVS